MHSDVHDVMKPMGQGWLVYADQSILILKNEYDSNQGWLPLGNMIFFQSFEEKPDEMSLLERHENSLYNLDKLKSKRAIPVPKDIPLRQRWDLASAEQRIFRFLDDKKVSNRHFKILVEKNFPGWERDEEGKIFHATASISNFSVRYNHLISEELHEWCQENCYGLYHAVIKDMAVYFELREDAMKFKLTFG